MFSKDQTPTVFVSYSHDNSEHKRWVGELADRLVKNGVDVRLDQWDLSLGDDVIKYMENSVAQSDRVLMVCSEAYVRKVNDGRGGVGYEAMVVTGELVNNLGTKKFIPVIRQCPGKAEVPICVGTRLYIDFSDNATFDEKMMDLLREIHQQPIKRKPTLGNAPDFHAAMLVTVEPQPLQTGDGSSDPVMALAAGRSIASSGNFRGWREFSRKAKSASVTRALAWRGQYDKAHFDKNTLVEQTLEGVDAFSPVMAFAIAGVESQKDEFASQIAVLDDLLHPKGWRNDGTGVRCLLPQGTAYVYQAVHGAMCLLTGQLNRAVAAARTRLDVINGGTDTMLWQQSPIVGWPYPFGDDSKIAWNALQSLPAQWPWITEAFGDKDEFLNALNAYYMALTIVEYTHLASISGEEFKVAGFTFVPPNFEYGDKDSLRAAYRLLLADPGQVRAIWDSVGVPDASMRKHWDEWNKCLLQLLSRNRPHFGSNKSSVANLLRDVIG